MMNLRRLPVWMALVLAVWVGLLPAQARAVSATGDASAEIIIPLEIVFQNPLDFGDFTATTGGTIVIPANPFDPESTTGDVTLLTSASAGPGDFGVVGEPDRDYNISGDSSTTIDLTPGGGFPMDVTNLNYRSTTKGIAGANPTTGLLDSGGNDVITVGGTLTVPPSPPSGPYTGTYNITINY